MKENFIKRSITSIFLIISLALWMFIGAVYLTPVFGTKPLWAAYSFMGINSVLLVISLFEIINLRKQLNWHWIIKVFILVMGVFFLWFPLGNERFGVYFTISKPWYSWLVNLGIYLLFILILLAISTNSKNFVKEDVLFLGFWIVYLVITFKAINFLMLQGTNIQILGWPTLLYLWIIVISNDTGAYLGGMLWGKKPLAPVISPKKTWEGAICGFVCSFVFSITLVVLLKEIGNYDILPFYEGTSGKIPVYVMYVGISMILAVLSQLGDLLFSYLKRKHNVKDFSKIFPGHGGLLDRLDSFSAVAILTFFICSIIL